MSIPADVELITDSHGCVWQRTPIGWALMMPTGQLVDDANLALFGPVDLHIKPRRVATT